MNASRNVGGALPRRPLGRTGCEVTLFGLGGEGVLRTNGREAEAVRVIQRALDKGVNYCDTAPAYAGSLDYYGAALDGRRQERGRPHFIASLESKVKTVCSRLYGHLLGARCRCQQAFDVGVSVFLLEKDVL